MIEEFKDSQWNFLEVSRKSIKGDVIALHQILISFFTEFKSKFPINPLENISAPGLAFKTWRTQQLPLLHKDNFKVYDLSRNLDPKFREAYLGGIVDVYRPHLKGQGYYYDVNSLYPTAILALCLW
jgi:DNA polymerase family B